VKDTGAAAHACARAHLLRPWTADPAQTYDRMTPLAVDEACLPNGWSDVQPGDAIVAFSRQQLYHIRKARGGCGLPVGKGRLP
jgi:hypothetical protein